MSSEERRRGMPRRGKHGSQLRWMSGEKERMGGLVQGSDEGDSLGE